MSRRTPPPPPARAPLTRPAGALLTCLLTCHLACLLTCLLAAPPLAALLVGGGEARADVRPSDLLFPTDHEGLGRGYAAPPTRYTTSFVGTAGGASSPYISRSMLGVIGEARLPLGLSSLGLRSALLAHTFTSDTTDESGLYMGNLSLDWGYARRSGDWRGRGEGYGVNVGLALPTGRLSDPPTSAGEGAYGAGRDARDSLAAALGGLDRWMWEPNSMAGFAQVGWTTRLGGLRLSLDAAGAYLYRVLESRMTEAANVYAQGAATVGAEGAVWGWAAGAGYGLALTSYAADVDRLSARVELRRREGQTLYTLGATLNLDPILQALPERALWVASLGVAWD